MSETLKQEVLKALATVRDPQSGKDLVANEMIKDLQVEDKKVTFGIDFKNPDFKFKEVVVRSAEKAVQAVQTKLTNTRESTFPFYPDPPRFLP